MELRQFHLPTVHTGQRRHAEAVEDSGEGGSNSQTEEAGYHAGKCMLLCISVASQRFISSGACTHTVQHQKVKLLPQRYSTVELLLPSILMYTSKSHPFMDINSWSNHLYTLVSLEWCTEKNFPLCRQTCFSRYTRGWRWCQSSREIWSEHLRTFL